MSESLHFHYATLRENTCTYRFWGLLDSCLAATECVREQSLNTPEEAQKVIAAYVVKYNEQRLHSSIGYVTPLTKLNGEDVVIFAERKEKFAVARMARKERRLNKVELAVRQPLARAA